LDGVSLRQLRLRQTIRDLGDNLALVPANRMLAKVESRLDAQPGTEQTLKQALATICPRQGWARPFSEWTSAFFDTVIIDTPPRLGPLTLNALAAADGVLIPVIAESIALTSLKFFLQTIDLVRRTTNPSLEVIGILPTFFDRHLNHHRQAIDMIRAWDMPLLDITIGRSVRVAEAAAQGQTVITFAPTNPRAIEYLVLGEMTRGWLKDRRDHR
jgi:chromosome partitioning protein